MTEDLKERARQVGGEALAKRVELLETTINQMADSDSLDQKIRNASVPLPDSALEVMSPEEKQEDLLSIETEGDEKANVITETVEIPAPGSGAQEEGSSTITVERKGPANSYEDMREFEKANQRYIGRNEEDRANSSQDDDLDIPSPGSGGEDDDE
ncbi:hypothetical protein [Natronococcus jeotgali]|uniref:Uncharacterized protein n=1 Tax=Natronococcus jeotgali DSM 18795 TaxID=1227498 RepID=L9XPT7_9EURY|nr:hypothetical protein [Natronococcus jeotgali]ELY63834.1 hypothetical protein C492_06931 [Natronococcus jeotgali DSM 18795]